MKPKHLWIVGTDTDAGKTYVTVELLKALQQQRQVAAFKPLASGFPINTSPMHNPDLEAISRCQPGIPLKLINQWCFQPAIAPHIAAQLTGKLLSVDRWDQAVARLQAERFAIKPYQVGLIEGAGGWMLPLNDQQTLDQWRPPALGVILVVGMKLGCLNHALLTAQAIQKHHSLVGWFANHMATPMTELAANIASLRQLLPAPCLGEIPSKGAVTKIHPLLTSWVDR